MTLIELVITVTLLGILGSVATLMIHVVDEPLPDDPRRVIADSLRVSVATGRPITVRLTIHGIPALATIHPDGSIVSDSIVHADRLAGIVHDP